MDKLNKAWAYRVRANKISQTLCDWAEQNVKQANAAYEHLSGYRVGYGPISGSTQTSNP